jgi:hypothetical protein
MRVNLFSRTDAFESYGVSDLFAYQDETMNLPVGASYRGVAYSYNADADIYFRNENDSTAMEAYTSPVTRTSYTRSFPAEQTVASIANNVQFNVAQMDHFDVVKSELPPTMTYVPQNVLYTYHFEVLGVAGAENIVDTRGALSGMSRSYLIAKGAVSDTTVTLFFAAQVDEQHARIYGSFRSFGRVEAQNDLTIEVLTRGGNILQFTWDVTLQINGAAPSPDNDPVGKVIYISVDNSNLDIPNDGGGEGDSGFSADVDDWKEETITLN